METSDKHQKPIFASKPVQVLNKDSLPSSSPGSHSRKLILDDLKDLFLFFELIYGHIWMSQANSEQRWGLLKIAWFSGLQDLSIDELEHAKKACFSRYPKPPTAPEFYQLCRPSVLVEARANAEREGKKSHNPGHMCIKPGCKEYGVMSHSTQAGNWLCREHFRSYNT